MCRLLLSPPLPCPLPGFDPVVDPGLFVESLLPELEEVVVGFVFVLVLSLFACWFPLLTVFAMGGAW